MEIYSVRQKDSISVNVRDSKVTVSLSATLRHDLDVHHYGGCIVSEQYPPS